MAWLIALLGALAALVGATTARPATRSGVTVTAFFDVITKPSYDDVLIPNFERVYPNITVSPTYATGTTLGTLQTTELAAGNAPDLLTVAPGCGSSISVCALAKAGHLTALVREPWTKRSLPSVLSASKYHAGLFMFSPGLTFEGLWANDDMFRTLGLKVPQTVSQLLNVCRVAKAAGTVPLLISLNGTSVLRQLVPDIALETVYAKDKQWAAKHRAGKVTFRGTPGWRQALQELVDLKNAGCFQPGAAATTSTSAAAQFAQGHALMWANVSGWKTTIELGEPQFAYSHHPFPAGSPGRIVFLANMAIGLGVNAHSDTEHRSAAQLFVDFVARPKQNTLFTQGGITQYAFLHADVPGFMASFKPLLRKHAYAMNPSQNWWNADTANALTTYGTGLFTGQYSVDDVLKAMDKAWKLGPR